MTRPLLVVVCGLSFAGKTTLGNAVAERFGYQQVDVDLTKMRLYGVSFDENTLDQQAWHRIYDATDSEIERLLRSGRSVVDASRTCRKAERARARRLAEASGADFRLIHLDTPETVARERLIANRRDRSRADWGDGSFDEIVRVMEAPGEDEHSLVYHFADHLETWITQHARWLRESDVAEPD